MDEEWQIEGNVAHNGLSQFLYEHCQSVLNLSKPGGSNFDTTNRISNFIHANGNLVKEKLKYILVFQTEWNRGYHNNINLDVD